MAKSKLNNKPRNQRRVIGSLKSIEKRIYIFCEGQKTEKEYFDRMKDLIIGNAVYRNSVFVETFGLGMNTLSVLDYAKDYVEKHKLTEAQIWCVFDKDDFPDTNFNTAIQKIVDLNGNKQGLEYHAAWSSQCFEYWFVLHFDYYDSDTDRSAYSTFLDERYKRSGLCGYQKNEPNHFGILTENGNPKNAIKYAKRRIATLGDSTPAKSRPATTVHLLVENLAGYFPTEIQLKYL